MSIDRGVRACQLKPYTQGESVPLPDDEISEEGILSTAHRPGKIKVEFTGKKDFPQSMVLRTHLKVLPIDNKTTYAQLVINQATLNPVSYYRTGSWFPDDEVLGQLSLYKEVDLYFAGYGLFDHEYFQGEEFRDIKLILPEDKIILRKTFPVQTIPLLLQKNIRNERGEWMITSPYGHEERESTPIIGFGGFYKTGIDIEKIQPVFTIISSLENDTALKLYSLLKLEQDDIVPPDGGMKGNSHWYFAENLPLDQYTSLGGLIRQGKAQIRLRHHLTQEEICYVSKDYQQPHHKGEDIDIIFMPHPNQEKK